MRKQINNLIRKTTDLLYEAEQFKKEHAGDIRYNNDISIASLGSMLLAYKNVLAILKADNSSENLRCKGLPKEDFLRLIDECISGTTIFTEDVLHILDVYGDTYTRDKTTIAWKKENNEECFK